MGRLFRSLFVGLLRSQSCRTVQPFTGDSRLLLPPFERSALPLALSSVIISFLYSFISFPSPALRYIFYLLLHFSLFPQIHFFFVYFFSSLFNQFFVSDYLHFTYFYFSLLFPSFSFIFLISFLPLEHVLLYSLLVSIFFSYLPLFRSYNLVFTLFPTPWWGFAGRLLSFHVPGRIDRKSRDSQMSLSVGLFLSVCLHACEFVFLSVYLYIYLSANPYTSLFCFPHCMLVYQAVCLTLYPSISIFVWALL